MNLGERRIKVERARLGLFLRLSRWAIKAREAVSRRDSGALASSIINYMSEYVNDIETSDVPGIDMAVSYVQLQELNRLDAAIPILRSVAEVSAKVMPWDYEERVLILWVHMIASYYHWPLTEIHSLWPDEAIMFVQEIMVDDQLRREWEHSLSQVAYKYDKKGHGQLVPLKRPRWMLASGEPKKGKILKRLLPAGHIIDLSGVNGDADKNRA